MMRWTLATVLFSILVMLLGPAPALGETERRITSNRILLGDLVKDLPPDAAALDLGPAPPVGSSRLFLANDLMTALRQAGNAVPVRDSVRVVRESRKWSQIELHQQVTSRLVKILPTYAKLVQVDLPKSLVTPLDAEVIHIALGQLPPRRGTSHTTAMLEWGANGNIELRLPVSIVVELSDPPKPVTIERGATVNLVIGIGSTTVSAAAVSMQVTAVGTTALFRVIKTRKALRARLVNATTAEVVSE